MSLHPSLLINSLVTAVLTFDDQLRLLDINNAGEDLLSISARQTQGHRIDHIVPTLKILTMQVDRAVNDAQAYTERDLKLQLADDRIVIVDCAVTRVRLLLDRRINRIPARKKLRRSKHKPTHLPNCDGSHSRTKTHLADRVKLGPAYFSWAKNTLATAARQGNSSHFGPEIRSIQMVRSRRKPDLFGSTASRGI